MSDPVHQFSPSFAALSTSGGKFTVRGNVKGGLVGVTHKFFVDEFDDEHQRITDSSAVKLSLEQEVRDLHPSVFPDRTAVACPYSLAASQGESCGETWIKRAGNGQLAFYYRAYRSGIYQLKVFVGEKETFYFARVELHATAASAAHSTAWGTGLERPLLPAEHSSVIVRAHDVHGNALRHGSSNVQCQISGPEEVRTRAFARPHARPISAVPCRVLSRRWRSQ